MVPPYYRPRSAEAPKFTSENYEILRGIDAVAKHVGRFWLKILGNSSFICTCKRKRAIIQFVLSSSFVAGCRYEVS